MNNTCSTPPVAELPFHVRCFLDLYTVGYISVKMRKLAEEGENKDEIS